MTTRPNLFDFATSELSQDALLCWLLSWADQSRAKMDCALHQAGMQFLASIFKKFPEHTLATTPDAEIKIEIKRQYKSIDVLALVSVGSKKHALVIEDKTHTTPHGGQLERARQKTRTIRPWRDHGLLRNGL